MLQTVLLQATRFYVKNMSQTWPDGATLPPVISRTTRPEELPVEKIIYPYLMKSNKERFTYNIEQTYFPMGSETQAPTRNKKDLYQLFLEPHPVQL